MRKGLLCLAIVAFMAMPVMAEGWFVEMDFWYVQPDNSYQFGEFVDEGTSNDYTYTPASFDFDEDLSWDFAFGYDSDDYGIFTFSYWTYGDNTSFFTDDEDWVGNHHGGSWDNEHYYSFETDAYTADITWGQYWGNDGGWTGTWYVGLRLFDYEFSDTFYMDWTQGFGDYDTNGYFVNNSDGWGFCGGFIGQYEFNERFYLNGGIDVAFLRGDRSYTSWIEVDSDYYSGYDSGTYNDEIFPQYGFNLDIQFFMYEGFYGRFGYKYANWVDVTTYGLYAGDDYQEGYSSYAAGNPEDVNWDGFYLGLGYDFGK